MDKALIRYGSLCFATAVVAVGLAGCSDDPDPVRPPPVVDSGTGADDTGTPLDDTGTLGDADPDALPACPANPPVEEVTADVAANTEWTCQKTYLLKKFVEVKPGATLTIQAGTVIKGSRGAGTGEASITGIAVLPGAKILSLGTKERPVVMTSNEATPARGDWAGLMLLGKARSNHRTESGEPTPVYPEGLTSKPQFAYGSIGPDRDDADSSGELRYTRVEYAGFQLTVGNEINSFSFYGVGSGTVLDHLQAHQGFDDSFEWFGGTVNAKYLIATSGNDDCFDMDNGYRGKVQFAICNRDDIDGGGNGFEVDNDANGTANEPFTSPTVYNVTLIGKTGTATTEGGHGLHIRRNARGTWRNVLALNWPLSGLNIDGDSTQANATAGALSIRSSIIAGATKNGNNDFSTAYLADPANGLRSLSLAEVKLTDVATDTANYALQAGSPALTGAAEPPADGFFDPAGKDFIGACGTTCAEFEGWTRK